MDEPARIAFQKVVLDYYQAEGRHDLPWRIPDLDGSFDPYKILVSELMLQQTQVPRVIPKFYEFLNTFPSVQTLAAAPLSSILIAWSGLGYNRRAKFLRLAAQKIVADFGGMMPADASVLQTLSGVGKNTAGAIMAYAFNQPAVFIETNIRTVYIHHFFQDKSGISDDEILPLLNITLVAVDPRTFYWALMDYGTYLKRTKGNLNKLSKHYTQQSVFEGSLRQIRGQVIQALASGSMPTELLHQTVTDGRLDNVLHDLVNEGLIHPTDTGYSLDSDVVQ